MPTLYALSTLDDISYEIIHGLRPEWAEDTHYGYVTSEPLPECHIEFPFPPIGGDP